MLFIALGVWVEQSSFFSEFKKGVQRREVTAPEFGGRLLAEQLQAEGLLEPALFADPPGPRRSPTAWTLDRSPVAEWPSTTLAPSEPIAQGLRVASLWLPEDRHEYLLAEPEARGRTTEEPALLTLFDHGSIRWAGGVGLRLHGGRSRTSSNNKSYRVYFRDDDYHSPPFPPGILGWQGPQLDLRKLILHNDLRSDISGQHWQFTSPLAYDLAAELGCLVPRTAPLLVVVNGRPQGLYFATERVDLDYLEARFGHREFSILRTKRDADADRFRAGDRLHYRLLRRRVRGTWIRSQMEEWVDVENLENWFLSVLFNATTDPFQGALVLDERDPQGRWFWVNWDMDHSFMQAKDQGVPGFEADLFQHVVGRRHPDERGRILRRLTRWDPTFAADFHSKFETMLDQQLSPEVVAGHYDHYRDIAQRYDLADRAFLEDMEVFLQERPRILRQQAPIWLKGDPGNQP